MMVGMSSQKENFVEPDLSLHISPPSSSSSSTIDNNNSNHMDYALKSHTNPHDIISHSSRDRTELSLANLLKEAQSRSSFKRQQSFLSSSSSLYDHPPHHEGAFPLRPIKGIPIYNNGSVLSSPFSSLISSSSVGLEKDPKLFPYFRRPTSYPFEPIRVLNSGDKVMMTTEAYGGNNQLLKPSSILQQQQQQQHPCYYGVNHSNRGSDYLSTSSRLMHPNNKLIHTKKNMRAPRMRWTSSLHNRFVKAVELLGGHERATPKSVLELMDVEDLTLAHVKSHLQMYRTVKNTDKAAASSDGSGDDDFIPSTKSLQQNGNNLIELSGASNNASSVEPKHMLNTSTSNGAWRYDYSRESDGSREETHPSLQRSRIEDEGDNFDQSRRFTGPNYCNINGPSLEFSLGISNWNK